MKVRLVASTVGAASPIQFLSSYLVDGWLSIDAGSVGFMPSTTAQAAVTHVALTHTHLDHVASLPALIENVASRERPITVLAPENVLAALERHVFNDVIWPRLGRLPSGVVRLEPVTIGTAVEIGRSRVTPLEVDHVVPTCGYLVEHDDTAVIFAADTARSEHLAGAAARAEVRAVILEVAFPDRLAEVAGAAGHLTPATFAEQIRLMGGSPRVLAVHLKARHRAEIEREVEALSLERVEIMVPDRDYVVRRGS